MTTDLSPSVVTIQLSEELLDDPPANCKVKRELVVEVNERRLVHWRSGPCTRPPVAVLIVKCPEHGTAYVPICRFHLWMLKHGRLPGSSTQCTSCHRPVTWLPA